MVAEAQRRPAAANVRYVEAYADATGLPPGSADIATCSQSLHWMEPEPMLAEVARVLRPGGVFAAYDYDLPPAVHPGVDAAFDEFLERGRRLLAFPSGARARRGGRRSTSSGCVRAAASATRARSSSTGSSMATRAASSASHAASARSRCSSSGGSARTSSG